MNFNDLIRQLAHVADVFKVRTEDHYRKRAHAEIIAEIKKRRAVGAAFYANHFPCDALRLPDVIVGFIDRETVGGGKDRK